MQRNLSTMNTSIARALSFWERVAEGRVRELAVASLICLVACAVLLHGQGQFAVQETALGTLPGTIRGALQVSPNNRHVFTHVQLSNVGTNATTGDWALYRDGLLVGRYNGKLPAISLMGKSSDPAVPLQFSTDGEHYAFIAERNGRQFIVHDGVEGPDYEAVADLQLSPTGDRVSYVIRRPGERRLVFDGEVGPASYSVSGKFSPDGRRFFSIVSTGSMNRIFLDGQPLIEAIAERDPQHGYLSISNARFSPDSRHFVFIAESNRGARVVLDGKTVGTYQGSIESLSLSPDGRRLAFVRRPYPRTTDSWALIVDGVETPLPGTSDRPPFLAWSPDSQHLAYADRRDNPASYPAPASTLRGGVWRCPTRCWRMVLDGVESPAYFDLDADHAGFLNDGRLVYSAFDGTTWITRIGNEQIPGVRIVAITPDGVHRAFALGTPSNPFVIDGKRYSETAGYCCFPRFSGPAGKHFVHGVPYPADETLTAIDGIRQPAAGMVIFTPDENHVAYLHDDEVLVDGVAIVPPGVSLPKFSFNGNEGFRVFGLRGNQLIRIDARF